jgi:hypothetical protein
MQESMRDQLEAGAKKRGWTVTEELLWRLRGSFAREEEEKREPIARALCYLISQIADVAHASVPGLSWHRDPFMFRAFKLGVAKFLDGLEPQGEAEPPPFANLFPPNHPLGELYKRPESVADFAAASALAGLFQFHPKMFTQDQKESAKNEMETMPGWNRERATQMMDKIDEGSYSFARARRALGIDEPEGELGRAMRRVLGIDEPKGELARATRRALGTDEPLGDLARAARRYLGIDEPKGDKS